ncbi:MAG: hypothetical protein SNJ72_09300 [Fimbriimonadales bacterium]
MRSERMQRWRQRWWQDPQGALEEWETLIRTPLAQNQIGAMWRLLEWWADLPLDEETRQRIGDELWGKMHTTLGGVKLKTAELLGIPAFLEAIEHFEAVLTAFTEDKFPEQWADAHSFLGIAYANLPIGDRHQNAQKAVEHFTAALRVYNETEFPDHWASTFSNLATTFFNMPDGDKTQNLLRALDCFQLALKVWTKTAFPASWARTMNNIGSIYAALPTGDRRENLQKAVAHFEEGLTVFTFEEYPEEWTRTQYTLGQIYSDLADETGELEPLRRARECYADAWQGYKAMGREHDAMHAGLHVLRTHALIERAEAEAEE